jgi:hypothetical protein
MPTYADLVDWAGAENVVRADPVTVAGWKIPEEHKALLVNIGVPLAENLIEDVAFQPEAEPVLLTRDGRRLYRLTKNHQGDLLPDLLWAFGAEPVTGTVHYVLPDGEAWFANSSIDLWLQCLHYYGRHLSRSEVLNDPDEREEEALAELGRLAAEMKEIDPPAFDGYRGCIWAEFLDRWLW